MLQSTYSEGFAVWLQEQKLSLAFTTYQTNRLFCVGTTPDERIALHERLFDKPMGLFAQNDRLYMSTRYQIWQLQNLLAAGEERKGCDRLYTPKLAYTTGDLNVHDVVLDQSDELLFVNTDFSCLARLSPDYNFIPVWQPPFISKLVAEDRCHLNGLAMRDGQPAYMTACSTSDKALGWRNHRVDGGVVMDLQSNQIIATRLSMPHSPRWHDDKLWVLNSGSGELGYIDLDHGTFRPLSFCPGFVRGLAFSKHFAFVGLSKLRSKAFTGLALEERLNAEKQDAQCGLMVIDLNTGDIIQWLRLEGVVEELFDVVVLPEVRQPQSIGFQSDEIERLVTFPEAEGIIVTKPTVKRPSVGDRAPVAGMPRKVWEETQTEQPEDTIAPLAGNSLSPESLKSLKFQQVYNLTPLSLADYDPLTFPKLQKRWETEPATGELFGISASLAGDMIAFAIAELYSDQSAQIISLFVAPNYRQNQIGTRLVAYLERELRKEGCVQIAIAYSPSPLTQNALEPILAKLGWQTPYDKNNQRRSHKTLVSPSPRSTEVPSSAKNQFVQGKQFAKDGNLNAAETAFLQAIKLHPTYLQAHNQLGKIYQQQGRLDEAINTYQTLLTLNPNLAQAHSNLGAIWQIQGKVKEAIAAYHRAIQLKPQLAIAHFNLAQLLIEQGESSTAFRHYQAAIQADPTLIEAQYRLGQILLRQENFAQAKTYFQTVLDQNPNHAAAWFDLGCLAEAEGDLENALRCYQHLFDHHPELKYLSGYQLCYVKRHLCDWSQDEVQIVDLLEQISNEAFQADSPPCLPLSLSLFSASPALHRSLNETYAKHIQNRVKAQQERCSFEYPKEALKTLNIGYVSPDYCNHPVGLLIKDLFQLHDRNRVQIFAYSLRHKEDSVQASIRNGCDQFIDCSTLSPEETARRIHADNIHILVDLAGYTAHCRPEIFALRPAPIQCSYLGYPDTTGSPDIDYLLTDQWVVPPQMAAHYSEEVIYLPHQFVASPQFGKLSQNSSTQGQQASTEKPQNRQRRDRQDYGLPPEAFIFCCFNAHRKIDPTVFATWMRILKQVPNSILWLSDGADRAKTNLQQSATTHGIESERLIFAPRAPFETYLARYRCADLFLDTFSYGAGSTGVCSLYAGVPMLTYSGNTNASRMGASICAAAGFDELICDSPQAYEQKAVSLATQADKLAIFQQALQHDRYTMNLFRPQQWIVALEDIFWDFWKQYSSRDQDEKIAL